MTLPSTDREGIDRLKNHFSKLQIADKDGDLDRDGYTAPAWWPMTLSNGATGTIDWVATFGLPEIPKAVWLWSQACDAGSAAGDYFIGFKAKVTTASDSFRVRCDRENNGNKDDRSGLVPVADNGTSYYRAIASGVNTMEVHVLVVGWMR